MTAQRITLLLCCLCLGGALALADEARWTHHIQAAGAALRHGDYQTAESHTEAALDEAGEFGPKDWRLPMTLEKLAMFYRARGRYDAALPLYLRLLDLEEKTLGPDHPNVSARVDDLAAIYRVLGRHDRAERLLRGRR